MKNRYAEQTELNLMRKTWERGSIRDQPRSGGQTAMKLMVVSTGEIWIHSEAKLKSGGASLSHLLEEILVWESESALYLVKNCAAKCAS